MKKNKSLTVYISEFVYGAIDGTVTTFAVVAAAAGAGLGTGVALVLGVANMLADGFSMGVSSFLAKQSEHDHIEKDRIEIKESLADREHLEPYISSRLQRHYGLSGKLLDKAVEESLENKTKVLSHIQDSEVGNIETSEKPFNVAVVTFLAFIIVGSVPLLAFVFTSIDDSATSNTLFVSSAILATLAFAAIGIAKGALTHTSKIKSMFETILLGGAAAVISFIVGDLLEGLL